MRIPEHLGDIAKQYWKSITKTHKPTEGNKQLLACLCSAYEDFRTAEQIIQRDGYILETLNTTKANPAIAIKNNAIDRILKITKQLEEVEEEFAELDFGPLDF